MAAKHQYVSNPKNEKGIRYRVAANGQRKYEFAYYTTEGQRRWKAVPGFDNLEAAVAARDEAAARLRGGERVVAKTDVTWDEIFPIALDNHRDRKTRRPLGPSSRRIYLSMNRSWISPVIGRKPVQKITDGDVLAIFRRAEEQGRTGSLPNIHGALSLGLKYAASRRQGIIGVNPLSQLEDHEKPANAAKAVKLDAAMKPEEVDAFLAAARCARRPAYDWALFWEVMIQTGARIGEAIGLQVSKVDVKAGTILIDNQMGPDGAGRQLVGHRKWHGQASSVKVTPSLMSRLAQHMLKAGISGSPDAFVFGGTNGQPMFYSRAREMFESTVKRAGLAHRGFTPHTLRHTCASILIDNGANVKDVQQVLGHKKASLTLDTYTHFWERSKSDERVQAALEAALG